MSEWKETTLKEVTLKANTGLDAIKRAPIVDYDSGIKCLRIQDVSQVNKFDDWGFCDVTESNYQKFSLKAGDVLIARTGNTIGVNIFIDSDLRSVFNNGLIRIKANTQKIQSKFLYYLFKTRFFEWHIKSIAYGTSTQPNMQIESLLRFSFDLPPLDIQDEILKTLSCLDSKIENLRRQNETLENIAQTLFKHWFIDFEFPNADGKPYKSSGGVMVSSELGDIPEGWGVGTLGDVVNVNHKSIDKSYSNKIIEYVDISSVGIGTLENTTQYKLSEAPSRARRLVQHGDVIWSGVRPNRKSYLFICKPQKNLVVSTGFIVLSPKKIPSSFLYFWVTTSMFVDYLTLNASGSAYPAVKAEHFEIAEIGLPSKLVLEKFHDVIDPMRIKIHENSLQIQTLTKIRDSLLPKLMSGQILVKE